MASTSQFAIPTPLFSGKNYDFLSLKMQACLQGLGCWESVELGFTEHDANSIAGMTTAQRKKFDEIKQKEGRVKSCILNSLDDSIFPKITAAKTASENVKLGHTFCPFLRKKLSFFSVLQFSANYYNFSV